MCLFTSVLSHVLVFVSRFVHDTSAFIIFADVEARSSAVRIVRFNLDHFHDFNRTFVVDQSDTALVNFVWHCDLDAAVVSPFPRTGFLISFAVQDFIVNCSRSEAAVV